MKKKRRKPGLIFVVSGPSGSGKTTLAHSVLKHQGLKQKLVRSISFTTRPKRSGERDGRDYFFITEDEFLKSRRQKKILEWTKYLGYYYATSRDFVERELGKAKHILLSLDVRGAKKVKEFYPGETRLIFILPPSLKALKQRIEGRCRKTKQEEIRRRLKLAEKEILLSKEYDYCLVNKNLSRAVDKLGGIILREVKIAGEKG